MRHLQTGIGKPVHLYTSVPRSGAAARQRSNQSEPHSSLLISKRRKLAGCRASTGDQRKAAEARLASLIDTSGDGEQELLDRIVAEESGEQKFGGYLLWSFLVLGGSILICSWQDLDPYGGASFSVESAKNALWGVALATPIAVYKYLLWSPEYHEHRKTIGSEINPVKELQNTWLKIVHPVFGNLTSAQTLIIILLECLTNSVFAFSLLQMSIFRLLQWRQGDYISESTLMNVSLAIVAALAGWVNMAYRSPSLDQLDVVKEASSNADRYYRFTVPADNKGTAAEMAAAFKDTCKRWYTERRVAMYMVGMSSTLEAFLCGCVWKWTGDLSSALAACLLFNAPDYYYMNKTIRDPKSRL